MQDVRGKKKSACEADCKIQENCRDPEWVDSRGLDSYNHRGLKMHTEHVTEAAVRLNIGCKMRNRSILVSISRLYVILPTTNKVALHYSTEQMFLKQLNFKICSFRKCNFLELF